LGDSALGLLDRLGSQLDHIRHIGVLVPWANTVVEAELPTVGPARLIWHYARLVPSNHGTDLDDHFLAGIVAAVPNALHQLSRLPIELALVACTSAGFSHGGALQTLSAGADVPATLSAFDALISTLNQLGARRVVLLSPYPAALTEMESSALGEVGIEVLAAASLGLTDNFEAVPPAAIGALLRGLDRGALHAAGAVVLSCTAWPTLGLLATWEERLDRPVVSSNLAMAITALNRVCYDHSR
jgi:maleate isomerase